MSVEIEPPFGIAQAGRGLDIAIEITERDSPSARAAKDLSDARWHYHIRAFDECLPVPHKRLEKLDIAKGTATGWLKDYMPLGATTYPVLRWELVEEDASNEDLATPSGHYERVIIEWFQDVRAKPPTA